MTTNRPLCTGANGKPAEFATTDTLGGITGGTSSGEAMTVDQFGANYDDLLPTGTPTFSGVNTGDLTATNAATIEGITFGAGMGSVSGCIGVGVGALSTNISGTRNVAVGNTSLEFLTTGVDNVAVGVGAGENIVGGGHNVFVGTDAAKLVNAGTSATAVTESIVIGDAARVSGSSDTNTIVIGSDGRGEGSNTTVIGNSSSTGCHLFGTLKVGDGTDSTKTATLSCASITTGTNRTLTLPNASGTIVIGGGTCSGASSGTNTGDQTSVSGNAGTATALATARAIYGNNFDGSAALTGNAVINQIANGDTAIKSTRATDTSPTGNFLDFQTAAAASVYKVDRYGALTVNVTAHASTAERLLTFGVSDSGSSFTLDNGTTNANVFNPTFNGTIEATVEGVPISFFGTKGVDGTTNPAILFLGRHNTGGGNTDLSATVPLAEFRNRATSLVYVYGNGDLKLVKSGAVIGYGTGTGGTVTQATSRTTGVTLSKATGAITTNTTSLAAGASATFTVTNTVVTALDVVTVAIKSGQTNKETSAAVTAVAAGSFDITIHNQHASTAETGAIVINFAIIKGSTS